MPLQNRVTPFGDIIVTPERGTMLGNRGILHNDQKEIIRASQVRRWLCCVLEFKGIRRTIMKPGSYTELFFLDEATALAAGHRPCCECRRQAYLDFQSHWTKVFGMKAGADEMDRMLDHDRKYRGGGKKTYQADISGLPDGTFVAREGQAWLLHKGRLLQWTPGGYTSGQERGTGMVEVLTPRATVAILQAGYIPGVHESALSAIRQKL